MNKVIERKEFILTVSCEDVKGIVAAVAGFISSHDGFIIEANQFGDPITGHFFQRIHFSLGDNSPDYGVLRARFATEVATPFAMRFGLHDVAHRPRALLMVSKFGHCLNDLLHRYKTGNLKVDIPAVISNHEDMRSLVEWHGIPFYYFPLEEAGKAAQEAKIIEVIEREQIDVVVLARYMQILSPNLCRVLTGRAINIHHSFLPSFKGAKPYHQAHERGVKIIGATAHYVTEDLDEGPIIEQEVVRVTHTLSPDEMVAVGRDIESRVLARALKFHIEHRVLLNGKKTVVF
jgi:formyltetrahydrofolate deformylase